MRIKGNIWRLGNNIDTDLIISGKYLRTNDINVWRSHIFENLDINFAGCAKKGDIIVAGENFGCGSSREQAPLAIRECGIGCIIAKSFARIFFRNAINIGLLVIECAKLVESLSEKKHVEIEIFLKEGFIIFQNTQYTFNPFPEIVLKILSSGGLLNYYFNARK